MAKETKDENGAKSYKEALAAGVWVLIILAVLTVGEYIVATIAPPWGMLLLVVAVWKTYYVVKTYMHIGRLFQADEEAH
ncbi:MAG: hypothetical protein OEV06_10355 [Anaerolineae bacterium]|nr:hypothetical protein [Anaerolineae bacterium]